MTRPSTTLRKMIDDRVSLSSAFNVWSQGSSAGAQAAVATETDSRSTVGQVSLFGLKPYTAEQRFRMLKRMIEKGQVALASGVSLETVRHEMNKPENDGLAVKDLASKLAQKKMLKFVQAPASTLKVKQPGLAPAA